MSICTENNFTTIFDLAISLRGLNSYLVVDDEEEVRKLS